MTGSLRSPFRLSRSALLFLGLTACSSADIAPGADAASALEAASPSAFPALPPPISREVPAPYTQSIRETIATLEARLGLAPDLHVDTAKLAAQADVLLRSAGRSLEEGHDLAVRSILDAYPVGHLVAYPKDRTRCETGALPTPSTSLLEACTQPYGDHVVVSAAGPNNPLGLAAGDEIVAVDGLQGEAMLRAALDRPMCGRSGSPSASHRRAVAATTLLATIARGSSVTIKRVSGAVETKTVAALSAQPWTCSDPFGRGGYVAKAWQRADGAGVLHLPSFYPSDYDPNDPMGSVDRFMNAIRSELAKIRALPIVVIDLRGNTGGFSYVALKMVGGLPGAVPARIVQCTSRLPNTMQYVEGDSFDVAPSSEFAVAGKVAILSDGLSFSATDYYLRAASTATRALIVGRPSAGAYGSSGDEVAIQSGPGLGLFIDPWRCTDPAGRLLEGQSTTPHLVRDLDPSSLARGLDSDLEAAVAHLRTH